MDVKEKLTRTICTFPLIIVLLFSCVLITYTVIQNREKVDFLTYNLQQDFLEDRRERVLSQILQLEMQSENQARAFYQAVAQRVNDRLNMARSVVEDVYNANLNKSVEDVTARIAEALNEIHENNSSKNEYFFILTIDGIGVLSPGAPENEGVDVLNMQDKEGTYFIREFIKNHDQSEQEMFVWWFPEPEGPADVTHQKMGSVFYFAPCDLIIGTGEYVESIRKKMELKSLAWIRQVYAQEVSKVLVFDREDRIRLASGDEAEKKGSLASLGCRDLEQPFHFSTVEKKYKDGTFVTLSCQDKNWDGEFYVRFFPEWQWVVASSIDGEGVEAYLQDKTTILRHQNTINLLVILASCLGLITFVSWGSLVVSRRVSQYWSEKMLYDELTGLPNRSFFTMQLKSSLEKGEAVVVINLDIDNFSGINERFTRKAGDVLLRQVADRLLSLIPVNHLCHSESDEFLVFLLVGRDYENASRIASAKINELRMLFTQPFFYADSQLEISFSSGCCTGEIEGSSARELIRRASITLFRAKEWGRDSHGCYAQLEKKIERDKQLVEALPGAIEREEITLLYQPLVMKQKATISRLEALAHWVHPELGNIPLQEFVPIAEKNGCIFDFGILLVKKVCRDMVYLKNVEGGFPVVSINISSRQLLEPGFALSMINIIDDAGVDRCRIKLELRERLFDRNIDKVLPVLEMLNSEGFEFILDEFGIGSSSLSRVNRLPLFALKIAESLVAGLPGDRHSVAMARSIISVAVADDMLVGAEGVDTREQCEWLEKEGCDFMQGGYYAAPMTLDELSVFSKDVVKM